MISVRALGLGMCLAACSAQPTPAQAPAEGVAAANAAMVMGANTHFGQGWPERFYPPVSQSGGALMRDGLAWRLIEAEPGRPVFTPENSGHFNRLCAAGARVVAVLEPRHPLIDGGTTIWSHAGQAAFARYAHSVATHFGDCLAAVEIGNEINGQNNINGPAAADRIAAHVALLQAVYQAVKPDFPGLMLLGGSVNAVATGFERRLIAAGGLRWLDGLAVHPYRPVPEGLDWELSRLRQAMAAQARPIWITEFSKDFPDPAEAPAYLVKNATLMSAAGVSSALWYALADDRGFPTMGLYTQAGAIKPVGRSFGWLARDVLNHGRAVRLNAGEPSLFHYRLGADRQVIWGARRAIQAHGDLRFRNAQGEAIAAPTAVGDHPVIVEGRGELVLGQTITQADSLYDFARPVWQYLAWRADRTTMPLVPVDTNFGSFIGLAANRSLAINPGGMIVPTSPLRIGQRYVAQAAERGYALACARPKVSGRAPATLTIQLNGRSIASASVPRQGQQITWPIDLAVGDRIDFVLTSGDAVNPMAYRFRLSTSNEQPGC